MRKSNKLVYGVGVNDSKYSVYTYEKVEGCSKSKLVGKCPFYSRWCGMLHRCYYKKYLERFPAYEGTIVCDEWLTFSKFKDWMDQQEWDGKVLDKDLLVRGNKLYSPDNCIFIDEKVNNFLIGRVKRSEQGHLLGAKWNKKSSKWEVFCSNPLTGLREYLGAFITDNEAHLVWLSRKQELAIELSESEYVSSEVVRLALVNYYKQ